MSASPTYCCCTDGSAGTVATAATGYVESLVPLAVVLSIPAVRRAERAHRFAFPMALLAAGLLVRFHLVDLPTPEPRNIRPHDMFWIFAIGWAAAEARSVAHRFGLSALVVVAVPGYFGHGQRELFVLVGLLLLVWVPTVKLTRRVRGIVGQVAAASLYTYLVHWQVFPPLLERFGPLVAVAGSLLAGTVAWSVTRRITAEAGGVGQWARRAAGVPRASGPSPGATASTG